MPSCPNVPPNRRPRCGALVVGPSYRFSSGLSAYTYRLSHALAESAEVSVLLLRRLIPKLLYPGRSRVGDDLCFPHYDLPVFDGVDWFWGTSLFPRGTFHKGSAA